MQGPHGLHGWQGGGQGHGGGQHGFGQGLQHFGGHGDGQQGSLSQQQLVNISIVAHNAISEANFFIQTLLHLVSIGFWANYSRISSVSTDF